MYEGDRLQTALLEYTIDTLFELYRNLMPFQNSMQIQATIGVFADDNKQNTHVLTFNIKRSKDNSGLVKCHFEEGEETVESRTSCIAGRRRSNTSEVQPDEEEPPNVSSSLLTETDRSELLHREDSSNGNKSAEGSHVNQLQNVASSSKHKELRAAETNNRQRRLNADSGNAKKKVSEKVSCFVKDTVGKDQSPTTCDDVREQIHNTTEYSHDAEVGNSYFDNSVVKNITNRVQLSQNSAVQSQTLLSGEYSSSFDIENLLQNDNTEARNELKEEGTHQRNRDTDYVSLDQIKEPLDDESSASETEYTNLNRNNSEYHPTDTETTTSSDVSQTSGVSDFEGAWPSKTSCRNKSEQRSPIDYAQPSTSNYTRQSPRTKAVKTCEIATDGSTRKRRKPCEEGPVVVLKEDYGNSKSATDGITRTRRKPCGDCPGCKVKENCGKCRNCTKKHLKQRCQERQCAMLKQSTGKPSYPKQKKLMQAPDKGEEVIIDMETHSSDEESSPE